MASLARITASSSALRRQVLLTSTRGFRTSAARYAAQPFTMPAMSPTMTEGGIARWNVKEGQEFSTGDVLLEIETDKAQMDVEAQEDGVMAKIIVPDGSKGIAVGTRIAILAEQGDDLKTLDIPAEEPSSSSAPAESKKTTTSEPSPQSISESPKPTEKPSSSAPAKPSPFPPSPSVAHLLSHHSLSASQITGSGPKGRILKGDVLAHLSQIPSSSPSTLAESIKKLQKLDLSNIKIRAAPATKPAAGAKPARTTPPPPRKLETIVDFRAVRDVQENMRKSLGAFPPVTKFVAAASRIANQAVPEESVTADVIFAELVGAPEPKKVVGKFKASIRPNLPERKAAGEEDLFDLLGRPGPLTAKAGKKEGQGILGNGENVFSLVVEEKEAERAERYLRVVKGLLEKQPGQLVL